MKREAQTTLSAKVKQDTAALFEEAFEESGALTKDEFFKKLLNSKNLPENPRPDSQQFSEQNFNPVMPYQGLPFPGQNFAPAMPYQGQPFQRIETPETIEVERELEENELILSLNPAQLFALRETVLSTPDFAEKQNEIIEKCKAGKSPFFYSGHCFKKEYSCLWVENKPIEPGMGEAEKEANIKYNMGAYLINRFLVALLEGEVSESAVTPENLKAFIIEQGLNG